MSKSDNFELFYPLKLSFSNILGLFSNNFFDCDTLLELNYLKFLTLNSQLIQRIYL